MLPLYFVAQTIGAVSGSLFVKFVIGDHAKLGLNSPNNEYNIVTIFGVETLATIFLMGIILIVVSKKNLHIGVASVAIGGVVALDVFFLGPISGASMNPIRSLAPAIITGILNDLWIYWTAPFIGSVIVAIIYRKKFSNYVSRKI